MTHPFVKILAFACGALTLMTGCAGPAPTVPGIGVPLDLAEHRASSITDLRYEFSLSIPESRSESIRGHLVARFNLTSEGQPLVFDFAQPGESVFDVRVDGKVTPFETVNEHVVIPSSSVRTGDISIAIDFIAGDSSLNRNESFLYTLFVPDRARFALPIFDQPNLKARYKLELEIPAEWKAVANGKASGQEVSGGRATIAFEETAPISSYLFAFAAGEFEVETAERDGRSLRMLHRETDREKVRRNREEVFDLHATALDWLEEYTGIEYPFGKFDIVLIPSFQYNGMEHPAAILYRSSSLFLDETATQNDLLRRGSLIAHEVAHMWFGNLVTMDWFNDVWMKEVFANFMAAKIVNPSFPDVNHDLRFLLAHYPAAYEVDRTEGANPIRQELDNLNEAGSVYGAIIYQKAPIVMKHLELLMGEEAFREGLRDYLSKYRFGNATWPDLIAILGRGTDEDLESWSRTWVGEPGRPTLEVGMAAAGDRLMTLEISQRDPAAKGRLWNQRVELLLGYENSPPRKIPVHLEGASHEANLGKGQPLPSYVLINGGGIGYGHFALDLRTREYLIRNLPGLEEPGTRAVAWMNLWDAMLEQEVAPGVLADLAVASLRSETEELNVQLMLGSLREIFWKYLSGEDRENRAAGLEAFLWEMMNGAKRPTLKSAYFTAIRDVVSTEAGLGRLERIWSEEETIREVPLSENDFTLIAQSLAVRGVENAEEILDRQLERIENPDRKARFEFVRPALSSDAVVRDRFFQDLEAPENREQERWVLEGLEYLHHPLRAGRAERYIRPSLDLLEEIQRTGDVFFPLNWLEGTLGGHSSRSAAGIVREFLEERDDLPPRLRGKLLQAADPLFRAAAITEDGG